MKKATYTIISSFLFIILILIVSIGVVSYESLIVELENKFKDDLNRYDLAADVREKIFFCYGHRVDPIQNTTCDIPVIQGYDIYNHHESKCNQVNITVGDSSQFNQKFSYFIPIKENETTCLGSLDIYM